MSLTPLERIFKTCAQVLRLWRLRGLGLLAYLKVQET